MKELVSIVIPVYNVEKYLNRCVDSVVNQTYQNLEILLVDDGSPDNCPQICEEWAAKDERIRVIHKENAGLGMARNTGIQKATGKYICFFDSDDYVAPDIIEQAYGLAERTNAELTFFGMATVNEKGTVTAERIPCAERMVYTGEEVRQIVLPDLIHDGAKEARIHNLSLSACTCLFSMELIHRTRWRFVSERDILSEDSYALIALFDAVSTVAILPQTGYYYCCNRNSLTQTYRPDRYVKICDFYEEAVHLQTVLEYPEVVKERIGRLYLAFVVGALKQMAIAPEPLAVRMEKVRSVVLDSTLREVLQGLDISCYSRKIKLLFLCLRYRCWLFVFVMVRLQTMQLRNS